MVNFPLAYIVPTAAKYNLKLTKWFRLAHKCLLLALMHASLKLVA